jgi:hypothetical protein
MKVQQVDSSPDRMILVAMITSTAVLAGVASKWDGKLFASTWANKIAGWAVEHFKKHQQAPDSSITVYFEEWAASNGSDKDNIESISSLLAYLSREGFKAQHNHTPDFVLDIAAKHFTRNRIAATNRAAEADLEMNEVDRAAKRISEFRKIEMGNGVYDTFGSESLIQELFAVRAEPLIKWKSKAINNFFDTSLERDGFLAFWGKNKVGKSYFLLNIAWQAYIQGLKVAYFVVGDMSRLQVWPRLIERAARRSMRVDPHGWDLPIEIENVGRELPIVKYDKRHAEADMTPDDCLELFGRVRERFGTGLRVRTWPSLSVSIHGLEAELSAWEYDNFQIDVAVIDHADNLAPVSNEKGADKRDQIYTTWKLMRAMSQRRHALVVTASQADTKSFHARILTRDNFSDDRRKLDDVTGTIGINQTDEEKIANLYRLNWINGRTLRFAETECLWLASCLPIADPMAIGTF